MRVDNQNNYVEYVRMLSNKNTKPASINNTDSTENEDSTKTEDADQQSNILYDQSDIEELSAKIREKNQALMEEYRKAFRLTDKDKVEIIFIPKGGKAGLKAGSYINKPTSGKAQRLAVDIKKQKQKISDIENGSEDIPKDEKAAKVAFMRNNLKQLEKSLKSENNYLASLPKTGYIIVEREE